MSVNPRFEKVIGRTDQDNKINIFGLESSVIYTSVWSAVDGGKDVDCRTWKVEGVEANVDGADIKIKAGGYTPIQRINSAELVIDTPESGEAICVVMDTDGQIYVNNFDNENFGQMEFTKGMYICWIAKTDVELTEFESPSFNEAMFENIDENRIKPDEVNLLKYLATVRELRG